MFKKKFFDLFTFGNKNVTLFFCIKAKKSLMLFCAACAFKTGVVTLSVSDCSCASGMYKIYMGNVNQRLLFIPDCLIHIDLGQV